MTDFNIDLTGHEMLRRQAMLASVLWHPVEAFEGETEAYRLLYSNLNPEQQAIYDELVAAGVLPDFQVCRCGHPDIAHKNSEGRCSCGCPAFRSAGAVS